MEGGGYEDTKSGGSAGEMAAVSGGSGIGTGVAVALELAVGPTVLAWTVQGVVEVELASEWLDEDLIVPDDPLCRRSSLDGGRSSTSCFGRDAVATFVVRSSVSPGFAGPFGSLCSRLNSVLSFLSPCSLQSRRLLSASSATSASSDA